MLALVAPLVSVASCVQGYSADTPTAPSGCSSDVVPALAIAVRDSVTQKPIASGVYITGMVAGKQGTYGVSMPVAQDSLTIYFGTISGTYNFTMQKAGYQSVTRTGIVVSPADSLDCHPNTVPVTVLMQTGS